MATFLFNNGWELAQGLDPKRNNNVLEIIWIKKRRSGEDKNTPFLSSGK